jgi:hypothetical protein
MTFNQNENVLVLGSDGRIDNGQTVFHNTALDQDGWQCWSCFYIPAGTTVSERSDRSAAGREGDSGGNPLQTFPILLIENMVHVDDPRLGQQRFVRASEEAGRKKLEDYWDRAAAPAAAGDTSRLGAGLPQPPDVSVGQGGGTPAPEPVGVQTPPEHPEIPIGTVVGDQDAPPPAPTPEETKAQRKARKRHPALE